MKSKFKERSVENELLDAPGIPAGLLIKNLRELDFLNRATGGHAISLAGIKMLMTDKNKTYHIADLGCGSGSLMRYIANWARNKGYRVNFSGVDIHAEAIRYLKKKNRGFPEIDGFAGDYRELLSQSRVDIFHCGLFCHHLSNEELAELLRQMNTSAAVGFVINDLKRSRVAYYGAKLFTSLLRGSSLSKHDGPVSVLRGFKKIELEGLLKNADVAHYRVLNRPFSRFLVVGKKVHMNRQEELKEEQNEGVR